MGKVEVDTGVSLRNPSYEVSELINIIKCGIPGTGMPYFYRKSYKKENAMILF